MGEVVVSVENLSKLYRLGEVSTGTLSHDLNRWWHLIRGKEDPYLKVGEVNRRDQSAASGYTWALREISFQVRQGEVLGVIGRNGAGKSTLFKLLSRVTSPTQGEIKVRGRIASLLEVGTGFHPELTGRENIFLNGAILGMRRHEIRENLDDIVDFSGCAAYLDTPVKRYSSGMYVRLAFAVAAHLQSEILIVDEVLAVGDSEFQKRCMGKMKDVARTGRTVLFVSHNMAAVRSLTSRAMVLDNGQLGFQGDTSEAVREYQAANLAASAGARIQGQGKHTKVCGIRMLDCSGNETRVYSVGETAALEIEFETDGAPNLSLELTIRDPAGQPLLFYSLYQFQQRSLPTEPGRYRMSFVMQPQWLAAGTYSLDVATSVANVHWDHSLSDVLTFDVPYCNPGGGSWDFRFERSLGSVTLDPEQVEFARLD